MIRYWYRLLHGQFRLWQVLLLGMIWTGGGVFLQVVLRDLGGIGWGPGLLFYGSGAVHFWMAFKAVKEQRALEAMQDDITSREAKLAAAQAAPRAKPSGTPTEPPLPSPPRIGDDPFRNPPLRPVLVERPEPRSSATPIAAGDPADKPKILT